MNSTIVCAHDNGGFLIAKIPYFEFFTALIIFHQYQCSHATGKKIRLNPLFLSRDISVICKIFNSKFCIGRQSGNRNYMDIFLTILGVKWKAAL